MPSGMRNRAGGSSSTETRPLLGGSGPNRGITTAVRGATRAGVGGIAAASSVMGGLLHQDVRDIGAGLMGGSKQDIVAHPKPTGGMVAHSAAQIAAHNKEVRDKTTPKKPAAPAAVAPTQPVDGVLLDFPKNER